MWWEISSLSKFAMDVKRHIFWYLTGISIIAFFYVVAYLHATNIAFPDWFIPADISMRYRSLELSVFNLGMVYWFVIFVGVLPRFGLFWTRDSIFMSLIATMSAIGIFCIEMKIFG